jgi:acyl-coenzyme A thioesterase PaaI-like protein
MIARIPSPAISRTIPRLYRPCRSLLNSRTSPFRQTLHRFQCHSRRSTSTTPPPPYAPKPADLRSQFTTDQVIDNTAPPRRGGRSLRPYIYAVIFLLVGLTTGQYVRLVVSPPPLPLPGTKEDKLMIKFLQHEAEKLPLVKSLSQDPTWTNHDAYIGITSEEREHRLPTGPLGGARALGGFQRIFYNDETGECVTVVWFGGAIAGWPGVTHGGVIATILDESLGRCALKKLPGNTGVTASLELNYRKPAITNSFYVIRAMPLEDDSTPSKQRVSGRLETLDGRICVEAKGLFVVPKKYKTQSLPRV